jgi:hypothetical protein
MAALGSMWKRRVVWALIAVANVAVIAVGLSVRFDSGPLRTDFGRSYLAGQSLLVEHGQVGDFAASINNHANHQVMILRASLIPASGFAAPSLYAVAVGFHLDEFEGRGWPIATAGGTVHALPTTADPGTGWLYYGVKAEKPGAYATLGLRVTYQSSGRTYTINSWGPSVLCVAMRGDACDTSGELDQLFAEIRTRT